MPSVWDEFSRVYDRCGDFVALKGYGALEFQKCKSDRYMYIGKQMP
jgi:hypothetical protein